jgi:putative flippase GtrA
MNIRMIQRTLVSVGIAGALLATGLLLTSLFAGGSQEPFQVVRSVGEYSDMLTSRAMGLRISFTLDDIFIVVYTAFFVLLGIALREHGNPTVINLAIGAIVLTGLLDAVENSHILTMMTQVDKGLPIQPSELAVQMAASQVKFISSYFSIFLMGLSFPRETLMEKMAAWSFIFLQLPLGVLIFTAPREWVPALVIARGIFFIVGFILTSKIFWDRSQVG